MPSLLLMQIFRKLDQVDAGRFIEYPRSRNKAKMLMEHIFDQEGRRLKAELKMTLNTLTTESGKSSAYLEISRRDSILELPSLTASAICDGPALNFLKPIVGIALVICATAQSLKNSREAALELAEHSSAVTKCIVDRATTLDQSAANNLEALLALKSLKDLDFPIAAYPVLHHGSSETPPPYQIVDNGQSREEGLNYVIQLHALQYEAPALFTRCEQDIDDHARRFGAKDGYGCQSRPEARRQRYSSTTAFVPFLPISQLTFF
ncbi:hypothetical protein B0H14DRAFT_2593790 [Mycena olivaceomarginata]|nr:hypothetical protein B0H14DRAFT_2593790 [Mycena olivaceomarginata]